MRPLVTTTLLALAALVAFPPSSAAATGWTWPVRGEVVTPYRNGDDPYASGQHRGIDIAAPEGTAVGAAAAGTVTFAGRAGNSGLTVSVRTADDRFDLSYLHLASVAVRRGERLEPGQRIGAVGTTGTRSADPPHLHFGVRDAGSRHSYRNPVDFLPPPGRPGPAPEPPALPVEVPLLPLTPLPLTVGAEAPRTLPAPATEPSPLPGPAETPRGALAPGNATLATSPRASAPVPAPLPGPRRTPLRTPHPAHAPGRSHTSPRSSPPRAPSDPHARLSRIGPRAQRPHAAAEPPTAGAPPAADGARPGTSPPRHAGAKGGINLGWLAACAGLVMAALALGRPAGPVTAARHARAAISAVTRPLIGRS